MSGKYDFFDFSQVKIKWDWRELLFGVENNIIGRSDVINYATHILDEGILGFDLVLKVAIADEYEDILLYIHELSNLENFKDNQAIEDKWRYGILKELHDKKSNYDNFNKKVEEIYADFDYPEDMAGFIEYMPSIDGINMEESWQEYLTSFKEKSENK